jgi:acyl carrier protein
MTRTPSFNEFAEFIRERHGLSRKKQIAPETKFEDDLGITGDDGCDLLAATEKRFRVSLSSEKHGYRETFALGPNEFLFQSEGGVFPELLTIFRGHSPVVRTFTVGELYNAVQEALAKKLTLPSN